jgi:myo-inositol 2-dehydrogenase / D-chiro-inositol 1-dehydrogenase
VIRLGLIGCGEHSEIGHAIPLARYKSAHPADIKLACVCDLRRERAELFCTKYGFAKAYDNLDAMLAAEQLEAVIAVVPVERISEVGVRLLKTGIPCVVEKPLASSLTELVALRNAARATQNMVSVNRRFMPFLNRAIEWARSAGPLRYVRCTFTRHARTEPDFLWGTAVHAVDALRHIAGDIEKTEIRTLKSSEGQASWYGIDLEFENEVSGRIDVLPTAGVLEETYELISEGYRAIVTSPFGPKRGWRAFRENRVVIEETDDGMPEDVVFGFYDETTALIQSLTAKRPPRPTIEDVFPSVELCFRLAQRVEAATNLVPAKS